jgi:hypothetical protein
MASASAPRVPSGAADRERDESLLMLQLSLVACEAPAMQGLAVLGAFVVLVAAGCSASPLEAPRTPPADAHPTEICVLRTGHDGGSPLQSPGPAGGDATYVVRDNGKLVATVGQGYFCYAAPPGAHHVTVEVGPRSATIDVTLAPGERVFLQQSLSGEGVALARLSEAAPVAAPSAPPSPPVPVPPSPTPSPPASPPRRRPDGLVYGVDAGAGLASSNTTPATQATASFAALGSILIGIWPSDFLLLTGRIDASLLNGAGVADLAVHFGIFPGAASSALRNFMFFVDGGAAVPISTSSGPSNGPPIAGLARIGVGWQRWHVGPALVGPLLCGQIVRATGEEYAAVLGGITASLDTQAGSK